MASLPGLGGAGLRGREAIGWGCPIAFVGTTIAAAPEPIEPSKKELRPIPLPLAWDSPAWCSWWRPRSRSAAAGVAGRAAATERLHPAPVMLAVRMPATWREKEKRGNGAAAGRPRPSAIASIGMRSSTSEVPALVCPYARGLSLVFSEHPLKALVGMPDEPMPSQVCLAFVS